jgi:hypothetical protein
VSIPPCDRSENSHPAVADDSVDFCGKLFKKSFQATYAGSNQYKHHTKTEKYPCASRIIPRRVLAKELLTPNDAIKCRTKTSVDEVEWSRLFTLPYYWPNFFWKDGTPSTCTNYRSIINLTYIYFTSVTNNVLTPDYVTPHADLILSVLDERIYRNVPREKGVVVNVGPKLCSKNVNVAMFDDEESQDGVDTLANPKRVKRANAALPPIPEPISEDVESDTPSEDFN